MNIPLAHGSYGTLIADKSPAIVGEPPAIPACACSSDGKFYNTFSTATVKRSVGFPHMNPTDF